ncbi:MAG: ABC transporter ATP-binding protein [Candidatus Omnitrophica bacterium]|nr:ABC transporter ATP-binding protein [Candidatus Omnitrophota bacterium]
MAKKVIEIKNLNYSYPDGAEALRDIDLDVFEGESVGIIGPNGAGKSTLLLHLNGILRGDNHVRIFELEVNDKNLAQIRSKVGLVFQDPDNQLFMPTVFDDVSFGPINMSLPKKEVEASVNEALKEVDMLGSIRRPSHHLSFGEKRRVSIATVLSMKSQILALDEPSSNLDPKHRRNLINFLKELKLTKIIATHDLDLVLETCSKIVLLNKGKLIVAGKSLDILRDKTLLEKYDLEVP